MERHLIVAMGTYVICLFGLAVYNFRTRLGAIRTKKVSPAHFKAYQGDSSERVIIVGRHYDNHFQLPMLFFITCTVYLALKNVDSPTVALAWAFFATRIGHSFEHLGSNKLRRRALWFASGWVVILAMWTRLFIQMI